MRVIVSGSGLKRGILRDVPPHAGVRICPSYLSDPSEEARQPKRTPRAQHNTLKSNRWLLEDATCRGSVLSDIFDNVEKLGDI